MSAKAQRAAVDDGWLVRHPTGLLISASTPWSWRLELHVGLLALDRRGWVSHDAAAQVYRFPLTPADRVEFTLPRAARGLRTTLAVHTAARVGPHDVRTVAGLRISSPERTIADLARSGAPPRRVEAMVADAARRGLIYPAAPAGSAGSATKSIRRSTAPTSSGRRSA